MGKIGVRNSMKRISINITQKRYNKTEVLFPRRYISIEEDQTYIYVYVR